VPLDLDAPCGRHLRYRDLIQCGETCQRLAAAGLVDNLPRQTKTLQAMQTLCHELLDPVIDQFGALDLTYAFGSPALTREIHKAIAPELDQHAGLEVKNDGRPVCSRGGFAVDFRVPGMDSTALANWIARNVRFDRMYLYGTSRPVHVSIGPQQSGMVVQMTPLPSGRMVPRRIKLDV
jgi:hypothetical protein